MGRFKSAALGIFILRDSDKCLEHTATGIEEVDTIMTFKWHLNKHMSMIS